MGVDRQMMMKNSGMTGKPSRFLFVTAREIRERGNLVITDKITSPLRSSQ
jgi:hypothetical protein